eukprot:3071368-Rhodomonas_salina.2
MSVADLQAKTDAKTGGGGLDFARWFLVFDFGHAGSDIRRKRLPFCTPKWLFGTETGHGGAAMWYGLLGSV